MWFFHKGCLSDLLELEFTNIFWLCNSRCYGMWHGWVAGYHTSLGCTGMHHQGWSWGHQEFRVFQHQTLSLRWPDWAWSDSGLHQSSSTNSQACPLHPKPPGGFLWGFSDCLYGLLLCSSSYSKPEYPELCRLSIQQAPGSPLQSAHKEPASLGFFIAPPAPDIWHEAYQTNLSHRHKHA